MTEQKLREFLSAYGLMLVLESAGGNVDSALGTDKTARLNAFIGQLSEDRTDAYHAANVRRTATMLNEAVDRLLADETEATS